MAAIANLHPVEAEGKDELDSFMFQTVGWNVIESFAACLDRPLFRGELRGRSVHRDLSYLPTDSDEVEDLFHLVQRVKLACPSINAVATGAILSNYQRNRVENV